MHLFLRSIGYSELSINEESKLIKLIIKEAQESDSIYYNKTLNRGSILYKVSESLALCLYGIYNGRTFTLQYYYPILNSYNTKTSAEELTIERHIDKESYAACCEDIKTGVTLIFYIQNVMDYLNCMQPEIDGRKLKRTQIFDLNNRSLKGKIAILEKNITMSALSVGGMILLPLSKDANQIKKRNNASKQRKNLIAAAKKGDEEAIESLTIEDLDTYTKLSKRIVYEDVFTIVDSSFMPCGVECDQYSVVGEILDIRKEKNESTDEEIYIMKLECNDMEFEVAINSCDLIGEPAVGRRFKGQIWLQGKIEF